METKKIAKKKKNQKTRQAEFSAARAQQLYRTGKSVSEIAQAMGYAKGTGNNRVRNALITAGVYKPNRTAALPPPAPKRHARQAKATRAPQPLQPVEIPNDPETALKVCLRTIDVNASKLNLDTHGRGRFARMLMGMIATNFGVLDFQARRPVLVLDEALASKQLMQAANA